MTEKETTSSLQEEVGRPQRPTISFPPIIWHNLQSRVRVVMTALGRPVQVGVRKELIDE